MAEKVRYGQGSVYGSLAYDFNNPELYPETTFDMPAETVAPPRVEQQTRAAAAPRAKQSVAPAAFVGYGCAAVLLVFSLMARIQLTAVADHTARMYVQLSEMKTERSKLLIAYESAFNLDQIERYAINELGMQKPGSDQIFYIDGSVPDKGVVIEPEEKEDGKFKFSELFGSLGEYFGR